MIAGAHRIEAYKLLGKDVISCNVITYINSLLGELAEIDENLVRNELHYTDHGDQLARRKEIYEQLYPETRKEATLKQYRSAESADRQKPAFVEDTSQKTGASSRAIQVDLQISNKVIPEAKQILKEKDLPKTDALKLARKPKEEQKEIIAKIQSGEAKSVKEAIQQDVTPEEVQEEAPHTHPYLTLQEIKELIAEIPDEKENICFKLEKDCLHIEAFMKLRNMGIERKHNVIIFGIAIPKKKGGEQIGTE